MATEYLKSYLNFSNNFIFELLKVWPEVHNLALYSKMQLPTGLKRKVKDRLRAYVRDPFACDLLDKLLQLDPLKRINVYNALYHDFFCKYPMPCDLSKMMSHHSQRMFVYLASQRHHAQLMDPFPQTNASQIQRIQHNYNQDHYQDHIRHKTQ